MLGVRSRRRARRLWCRRGVAGVLALLVALDPVGMSAAAVRAPHGQTGEVVEYRPPVDGVVVDGFRPPSTPFGAGNRGLDYATAPGAPVHAAAGGTVVFAGRVGGALHVTLLHPDGLRTSYSFLASVAVSAGTRLRQGEMLGTSAGRLHFGVRSGAVYLDPAALLAGGEGAVRLVAEPPPEASAVPADGLELLTVVLDELTGARAEVVRHYATELAPSTRVTRVARALVEWWPERHACTAARRDVPRPGGRRIVVLVGGLGTTDRRAAVDRVDTDALGYAPEDVLRFSYRGGRTPDRPRGGPLEAIPAHPYGPEDTEGDLVAAAGRLRTLLAQAAAAAPGVPIDVIAHSQGGLVAQIALTDLASGPAAPPALDLVATLGAPHTGTDAATGVAALRGEPAGDAALAWLARRLQLDFDPDAASVDQMSELSPLIARLATTPPPHDVRLLSIGARGDLVVPAGHTRLWDAPNPIVDLTGRDAHTRLPGADSTTRELALALAARPPTCERAVDVLADHGVAEGVSWAEDAIGFAAWQRAVGS